ncbi:MAG: hypothetical protein ACD_36C00119G0001 [uncultured bacterium]|uniref:Uncharacterized protein n=1 Tax=Candidatus Gottesmanbacteria bacterium RIFCSPLOWO2_01_FULL_43_11b TaxID=1798392 RepID=A0A1F6AGL7_9BACT|nr:MAG: hypothetical protein ACD_36C00119G0001 [uncultured bacterium]OGG23900.1 MAG: hypothetical protein A3A79_01730 [Candidatus Gottesmanbacteria bacterium RIFCSPLOWO2_01_FULL_43_11b]
MPKAEIKGFGAAKLFKPFEIKGDVEILDMPGHTLVAIPDGKPMSQLQQLCQPELKLTLIITPDEKGRVIRNKREVSEAQLSGELSIVSGIDYNAIGSNIE